MAHRRMTTNRKRGSSENLKINEQPNFQVNIEFQAPYFQTLVKVDPLKIQVKYWYQKFDYYTSIYGTINTHTTVFLAGGLELIAFTGPSQYGTRSERAG